MTSPTLLAVARGDSYTSVSDMKTVYERLATPDKRLVVEPVSRGHGWVMLGSQLEWSPLARQVEEFIHQAGGG